MRRLGTRNGTSATAGRKSRLLTGVVDGVSFSKRVFFDQKYLVVTDVKGSMLVTAWASEADARRQRDEARRDGKISEYVLAISS